MAERAPALPPMVASKLAEQGADGERWLAGLPGLIADLERRWSVTVTEPLDGGSEAYVARVRTGDGGEAVLKLTIPGAGFAGQARTLAMARGRGYAALLACDAGRGAILLEALGPSMAGLGLPPEQSIGLLSRTLLEAWQFAEPAYDLGVVLRDWCEPLLAGDPVTLARRYCRLLAGSTGVDEAAIWEWGFLERVSTGLYILSLGAGDLAGPFLATADMLA